MAFSDPATEQLFKVVYGKNIAELVPEADLLARDIGFVSMAEREGQTFRQPVQLAREVGFTFNSDFTAFDLNPAESSREIQAEVNGSEILLRSVMSYALMNKAKKAASEGNTRAYVNATKWKVKNMMESMSAVREIQTLYGGGSGAVSNLGTVASSTNAGATSTVLTITSGEWATGLWAGMTNLSIDAYQSGATKINTNAPLVITAVNGESRQLTVSGAAADITALDAYILANANATRLFFLGEFGKSMLGFMGVCAASAAGSTYWGIDSGAYDLWKATNYVVGGAMTFEKAVGGLNRAANLGAKGKFTLYLNPNTWQNLNDDTAALRRYVDNFGGELKQGAESLEYWGQVGALAIKPHIYMKEGKALALRTDECARLGATDITFENPDNEGRIFRQLEDKAGVELRAYTLQAPFCPSPAQSIVCYTGIENA